MSNYIDTAIAIIKDFEGLRLKAYKPIPTDPWTIGYGMTGPGITQNSVWTLQQAEESIKREVERVAKQVLGAIKVPLNDNQKAALISLAYNIGLGAFCKSTLLRKVNDPNAVASPEFDKWVYSKGKFVQGLANRRAKERKLYES